MGAIFYPERKEGSNQEEAFYVKAVLSCNSQLQMFGFVLLAVFSTRKLVAGLGSICLKTQESHQKANKDF